MERHFAEELFAALESNDIQKLNEILQLIPFEKLLTRSPNGGRTILHNAVATQNTDAITCLLGSVVPAGVCTLLRARCNLNETAVHLAARNQDVRVICCLLSFVRPVDMLQCLAACSDGGLTPLHLVEHAEMYPVIIRSIADESRVEVLSFLCEKRQSVFLKILLRGCSQTVDAIMQLIPTGNRLQLLEDHIEDIFKFTLENRNYDLIRNMLRHLHESERLKLMKSRYVGGVTALHLVSENHELLEIVLNMIPEDDRKSILRLKCDNSETTLLSAVISKRVNAIRCILNSVPIHVKMELVELKHDDRNWTCLHEAAQTGNADILICLLESFSKEEKLKLLSHPATDGKCPFFLLGHSAEVELENKVIEHVIGTKNVTIKEFCRKMTEVSERYILHSAPTVLILYNCHERDGAEEEKECIENALKHIGANVFSQKDFSDADLLKKIQDAKEKDVSALIIITMSHGDRGVIFDKQNKELEIQQIIRQMSYPPQEGIPKVLILQACQGDHKPGRSPPIPNTPPSDFDANSDYNLKKTYELDIRDFLLLSSTLPGVMARRNFFIPKLADRIKNCHCYSDLNRICSDVNFEMSKDADTDQTPVFLSTLTKLFHFVWHPRTVEPPLLT